MPAAAASIDVEEALRAQLLQAQPDMAREPRTSCFRFGDTLLELVSDDAPLLQQFDAYFGDCADWDPDPRTLRVRCTATVPAGSPYLSLVFDGSGIPDPLDVALGIFRVRRIQPYVELAGPHPGWRVLMDAGSRQRMLIASNGRTAVINLPEAPPEFVLDCIVGLVQSVPSGVMFLHAASVGVEGSGALVLGPSEAGKSTNALALAMRGHAFLGDDIAAIRVANRELLPMPKSASLREGPLARMLARRLQTSSHVRAPGRNGVLRTVLRVGEVFPASRSGPLPLRFAFVLDGRKGAARLTPFQPGLGELLRLRGMVISEVTPTWGRSPGRDLMQLLGVVDLMSRLRCFLVELGSTEETAGIIERAMRG